MKRILLRESELVNTIKRVINESHLLLERPCGGGGTQCNKSCCVDGYGSAGNFTIMGCSSATIAGGCEGDCTVGGYVPGGRSGSCGGKVIKGGKGPIIKSKDEAQRLVKSFNRQSHKKEIKEKAEGCYVYCDWAPSGGKQKEWCKNCKTQGKMDRCCRRSIWNEDSVDRFDTLYGSPELNESETTSKLKFNKQSRKKGAKTDVYNVVKGGTTIGQVKWYSRLRGYGFLPPSGDESEVTEFVKEISKTHREKNKKNK